MGLLSLFLGACAATPPTPVEAPEPATVVTTPTIPAAPTASTAAADLELAARAPLPRHLLLDDAMSLVVIDVAALRRLGLYDSLRLFARDQLGAAALPCIDPLLDDTRRVVMTRALHRSSSAIVVEQPRPIEPLLDCLAEGVPSAAATSIGGQAGLEVRPGTIAMGIDGTLVIGNASGLSSLLGVPEPPVPEDEHRRGDVLADEFASILGDPPGLDTLIAELPRLSGETLVTAAQSIGTSVGSGRALIRLSDDGLHGQVDILGFGDQLGLVDSMPSPPGDEMMNRFVDAVKRSLTGGLADQEDAAPLVETLEHLQVERLGSDLRLKVDVAQPAAVVEALERLSRQALHAQSTGK